MSPRNGTKEKKRGMCSVAVVSWHLKRIDSAEGRRSHCRMVGRNTRGQGQRSSNLSTNMKKWSKVNAQKWTARPDLGRGSGRSESLPSEQSRAARSTGLRSTLQPLRSKREAVTRIDGTARCHRWPFR